jgi:hypothetical protein
MYSAPAIMLARVRTGCTGLEHGISEGIVDGTTEKAVGEGINTGQWVIRH